MSDRAPRTASSRDEILASIRQVVSDEAAADGGGDKDTGGEREAERGILELTREIRDDGSVGDIATGATIVEAATDGPGDPPTGERTGGEPIGETALEIMRPMIREWLDANLPAIVERVVEREVKQRSRGEDPFVDR